MYVNNVPPRFGITKAIFDEGAITSEYQTGSALVTITTGSASASFTAPNTVTVTAAVPSSTGPLGQQSPSELSTGAKVGIGLGTAAGVLLVLGALVLFILKRRKRNKNLDDRKESHSWWSGKAELDAKPEGIEAAASQEGAVEADSQNLVQPAEVDGAASRVELDSGFSGWEKPTRADTKRAGHQELDGRRI